MYTNFTCISLMYYSPNMATEKSPIMKDFHTITGFADIIRAAYYIHMTIRLVF